MFGETLASLVIAWGYVTNPFNEFMIKKSWAKNLLIYIIKPDKTRPASLLKGFKNIPQRVRLLGVRGKVLIARKDINIKQAMPYQYSLEREN